MLAPVVLAFVSLVEGGSCPAPVDVEARVRTILNLTPEQRLSEGFAVERREAGLYVALRSADDQLIGERVLPTSGSCDELAQAAAVVLSAWLTDVHPDFAGALPAPEPAPVAAAEPAPEPPPPPPPPRAVAAPPVARAAPAPFADPSPWLVGELVIGVGGELANELAAMAFVGGSFGAPRGFALSARAILSWPRSQPLGPGRVTWWRWPFGFGPTVRVESPSLALAASAGPAVAWLHLVGEAFDQTGTQDAAVWGGYLEALVSGRRTPYAPFASLTLQYYPEKANAYVGGAAPLEWPLPTFSLSLGVGLRIAP